MTDEVKVEEIFSNHKIDGVIHFAGLKAVGELVSKPLEYYYNNLVSTMVLSKMCVKYGRKSSCSAHLRQYGETKAMSERILTDTSNVNNNFSVSLLRYFNPVGAHESGLIGEYPNGIPNNLMPFVTKVAKGQLEKLSVFGNDYDTIDGTGVRDYIHVVDLAKGHVKAIENLKNGIKIYNLGTSRGTSVLELVNAFMKVNDIIVPYEIVGRRPGDISISFADASKAEKELGWKAELGIEEIVRDAWKFEQNNKKLFNHISKFWESYMRL